MDDIIKFPKHIRFPNMVVKQVFQKKIKFDPEGSNIKVWIRISSLFSQGVTCINVILWFHKCRSSFLPWGSLGNFKHGSAVRGYKFKSACLVNGVQKKKKVEKSRHAIISGYSYHLSVNSEKSEWRHQSPQAMEY